MASMDAITRAAGSGGGGGPPPGGGMPPDPGMGEGGAGAPGKGMDEMVSMLEGVGQFLQAQAQSGNPAATEAMTHFQALLQSMASLGGEGGPEMPPETPAAPGGTPASGKIPEHGAPGAKVM